MNIFKVLGILFNVDCMDDLFIDFEGFLGGLFINQIIGVSDIIVNESLVILDFVVWIVGVLQVVQDIDFIFQEGEVIFIINSEQELVVSSDFDIFLIMVMEVGLFDIEFFIDQDCEEVKF